MTIDTGTLNVTVTLANNAPVAVDDSVSVTEDGTFLIDIAANDTDVDGNTPIMTTVCGGSNGAASIEAVQLCYTPEPDFDGSETLGYTISDGNGGSETGTLMITIDAVSDPPSATDHAATITEGGTDLDDVLDNDSDPEGDALWIGSIGTPANGTASIEAGQFRCMPGTGFNGTEQ